MKQYFHVAIDGPAGAGKSTVARCVAEKLGVIYVDTGAMYRSIAWKTLQNQINILDEEAITHLAESTSFSLLHNEMLVDGIQLKDEIRTPEVSALASAIAQIPGVRRILLHKQQKMAKQQSIVMDGRDIGTQVLTDADIKIFLTASIKARAQRRYKELDMKGIYADEQMLQKEIRFRDENDRTRKYAPLKKADDAIEIDTTHQSIDQAVQQILQLCWNKIGGEE